MKKLIFLISLISAISVQAHTRLTSPVPRSNNSGIKTGPCGGLPKAGNPTTVQGGQILTVQWQETINHPGKFLINLSMANDANFTPLAVVNDDQNAGATPHNFSAQISVPDINCEQCTLQMIQSMEENPAAPTYYYSCADIRIVASSQATPVQSQDFPSTAAVSNATFGGGCMMGSGEKKAGSEGLAFFLLPLMIAAFLRSKKAE